MRKPRGNVADFRPQADTSSGLADEHQKRCARRICSILFLVTIVCSGVCFAQSPPSSALPWLGGFDADRLSAATTDGDDTARILYRIGRTRQMTDLMPGERTEIGADAGGIGSVIGNVAEVRRIAVTPRLVEPLGFAHFYRWMIDADDGSKVTVYSQSAASGIQVGDASRCVAITLDAGPAVVVTPRVHWNPKHIESAGQRMLSEAGFDLALIDDIAARDRQSLDATDGESFYAMLAAAHRVHDNKHDVAPEVSEAIDLLTHSRSHIGHRVRLMLDIDSVTRIAVDSPRRAEEIGQDHYFQIDAFATLDGNEIIIRAGDGSGDEIKLDGRYPISIVGLDPPAGVGGDVGTQIRRGFIVEGFSYRLWRYDNELTAGTQVQQFAPLVVGSNFTAVRSPEVGNVRQIGVLAAAATVIAFLAIVASGVYWSRSDRGTARRRLPQRVESFQAGAAKDDTPN